MALKDLILSTVKRYNKLVNFAIRYPYFIVVACLIILILGSIAVLQMPKDLLPAANLPAVQILTFYPGMGVRDVEENLSSRFERYTGEAVGVRQQNSLSLLGVSVVKNYFTSDTDVNTAITQTTALVMSTLSKLPPGTQPPLILPFDPMASIPLALVAVSGTKNQTIEQIYDIARYQVRNSIQTVPGAMAPTIMGGTLRQVTLYLDPDKLSYYNFSPIRVLKKFSPLNTFIPAGDVKIGDYDYQINSNALVDKISEMNDFPLRAEYGTTVYLKDVGQAEDSGQIQTNVVLIDGREQVYVPVFRQPGRNSINVVDQTKIAIKNLEKTLDGIKLDLISDQTSFIRNAIDNIYHESVLGALLAALMIMIFLGNPRSTIGILVTFPITILFAMLSLETFSQSINAMTLGGIALSIGVLVDNSIVVIENITKKLEAGMSSIDAALEGASQVATPVLASTLATLTVLFPVMFLGGIVKVLFSALAVAVMLIMIGSYFVAMTLMPLMASRFLHPSDLHSNDGGIKGHYSSGYNKGKFELLSEIKLALSKLSRKIQDGIQKVTDLYGKQLNKALHHRKYVIGFALLFFLCSLLFIPTIGFELFPRADAGNFLLKARLKTGTRIEKTTEFAKKLNEKLREWIPKEDLHMIVTNAGIFYGWPAAFTPNVGTQDVFFDVELTKNRKNTSQFYAEIIRKQMKQEYPDVEISFELGGLLTSALNEGQRSNITILVSGQNINESYKLAQSLQDKIKTVKGAVDVRIQQRFDQPIIYMDIDREKSLKLGIYTDEIVKDVVSAVSNSASFDTKDLWIDPKTGIDYPMGVQYHEKYFTDIQQLGTLPIQGENRERSTSLDTIAKLRLTNGPSQVNHVNYKPVINIYLDSENRDIGSVADDIQKIINKIDIPDNYSAKIGGEITVMKESVQSLGGSFLLAALLVYLILVVQFGSFRLPLIIMVAVPMGLSGIIYTLAITNTYFSIQAAIGAIFMIGIAVANSVLLIEFLIHRTRESEDYYQGIIVAAKERLRPISMTSLAVILALIPMAIGIGRGSEVNTPLGRAVIGGQLFSVLLTLFVVPCLYSYFGNGNNNNNRNQNHNKDPNNKGPLGYTK